MDLQKKIDYKLFGDSEENQSEEISEELENKGLIIYLFTTSGFKRLIQQLDNYLEVNDIKTNKYVTGFGWAGSGEYFYFYRNTEIMTDEQAQLVLQKL